MKISVRYVPRTLKAANKKRQIAMLNKSRKLYKKGIYYTRKAVKSYKYSKSKHVRHAQEIYGVQAIKPSKELAHATRCSIASLQKIVRKGEGAYYSSGSRPNQTAQSWGRARLASAITGGKSAAVDYHILLEGCNHTGRAFKLAQQAKKKYGYGRGPTPKINTDS